MIKISIDLSRHCIQTETKRVYERLVMDCFTFDDLDKATETKLGLLKQALETFDFKKLRAGYPELAGGSDQKVTLAADDGGRIVIMIDNRIINP